MKKFSEYLLEEVKLTKKQQEVIDYAKTQINLDLEKFLDDSFAPKRKYFDLNKSKMTDLEIKMLNRLASDSYKGIGPVFRLEPNGYARIAVILDHKVPFNSL